MPKKISRQTTKRAAKRSVAQPPTHRLARPKFFRNGRDSFVLVLTNAPDRVDGWQLAQHFFRGRAGAGDICPPTGLGKRHFHQDLMNETGGDVPLKTCLMGIRELRAIIAQFIDAQGFERHGAIFSLTVDSFLEALKSGKWTFVKFLHLEDE